MSKARFVFHGLFPDVRTGAHARQIAKVLFDVDFNGEFHSHLLADIELIAAQDGLEFEVRCTLPFICKDFAGAAVQYYQYVLGPQAGKISHSGPKGASLVGHNVMRAQWSTELEADEMQPFEKNPA